MKLYALLLLSTACFASENKQAPYISNVVTVNAHTGDIRPARPVRPGPKHPDVIKAHEQLRREQEERDAVTCCCFFKIKKRI